MARKKNQKVVKFRKSSYMNIGILFFGMIFIYLVYNVYLFFTTSHISIYEVNQGNIVRDTVFQGLILREETVTYAEKNGYINYYCKDGSKVGVGNYVYSIDGTGEFYHQVSSEKNGQVVFSEESYAEFNDIVEQYMNHYSNQHFHQIYQFRQDLEATLVEALNANARNEIQNAISQGTYSNFQAHTAKEAGIVLYYVDGMEDVTKDTFSEEMFDSISYEKNNFLKRESISAGEPAYKTVTSEYWEVVIPIDLELSTVIQEEKNIQVEFKQDGSTAWAETEIVNRFGNYYLILGFKNSMVRFASNRYVELELLLPQKTGLKIPNSAIVEKDFLLLPMDYVTKGGNSDEDGILIERMSEEGILETVLVEISVFYEKDGYYYISSDEIKRGDVTLKPNTNERYHLQNTETLPGVYNLNRGYAVFRRIEKLSENPEYTIIESGTKNGISAFDYIALDSSTIKEEEILH